MKLCVKCGEDDWVPNGKTYLRCNTCLKRQRRDRYEARKDEILAKNKLWHDANPEKLKEAKKKWRDGNPERCKEAKKGWMDKNKGRVREYCANRRASLIKATPAWADREEMKYVHSLAHERGLVVDHMVPLNSEKVCGLNTPDNLRCISEALNARKGNRYWPDMAV